MVGVAAVAAIGAPKRVAHGDITGPGAGACWDDAILGAGLDEDDDDDGVGAMVTLADVDDVTGVENGDGDTTLPVD
jgi:hypothetical protein